MLQYSYKVLWICFLINHFSHVDGLDQQCGQSGVEKVKGRIRGGGNTKIIYDPWTVSLRGFFYYGCFHCGGTIIGRKWVVTAAHCITDGRPKYVTVGETKSYSWWLRNRRLIKNTHIHPSYHLRRDENGDTVSVSDDIGLLELDSKLTYSPKIQPICVSRKAVRVGQKCETLGWGTTASGKQSLKNLMKIFVNIGHQNLCNRPYFVNPNDMICGKSSPAFGCHGDSGGPLMCKESGRYFLKGVVNTGTNCSIVPGFNEFANVAHYIHWIEQVTGLGLDRVTDDGPVVHERMYRELDRQPGRYRPDRQPGRNESSRQPQRNEPDGQPGRNEQDGQSGRNEHDGQPGRNEPEGQPVQIEPDGQPGRNEPDGQPGSNEPDGQAERNGLSLPVGNNRPNGLDNHAGSPMSTNTASMSKKSSQIFLFVGVPILLIGLIGMIVVAVVLYRKSSHLKEDSLGSELNNK